MSLASAIDKFWAEDDRDSLIQLVWSLILFVYRLHLQRFRTGLLDKNKLQVEIYQANSEMKISSYGTENISYQMRPTLICSDPLQSA